jgi:hypothetical protein
MADLTIDQIDEMISAINTKLLDLVGNPKPSYKVGEYEWKWSDYHRLLLEQLKYYRSLSVSTPWSESTYLEEW